MYIKMDSYGKNINVGMIIPSYAKHKGKNVYCDSYGNIYLEFSGYSTSPVYRDYSGNIDQVSSVKIYYSNGYADQVGSYKVYHSMDNKVIEINGIRI